jgi:NNP family nitrate/nitrite transporter-like MFS transporter
MTSFMAIFVLSGVGNGSVYKMIPTVIGRSTPGRLQAKRMVAATVGIAGAIGALGGVLVQVVIRDASLHVSALETAAKTPAAKAAIAATHTAWVAPALWAFLISYAVFGLVTYVVYVRTWSELRVELPAVAPV